jgi:hypothetical protein
MNPGLGVEKPGANGHVYVIWNKAISLEQQPSLKFTGIKYIQIHRRIESKEDKIQEKHKTYFPAVQTFNMTNFVLLITRRQV